MAFKKKNSSHLTYHVDESVPVQDSPANSAACIPVEQGATVAASSLQVFHSKHSFSEQFRLRGTVEPPFVGLKRVRAPVLLLPRSS
jgi:hypothetical protein